MKNKLITRRNMLLGSAASFVALEISMNSNQWVGVKKLKLGKKFQYY